MNVNRGTDDCGSTQATTWRYYFLALMGGISIGLVIGLAMSLWAIRGSGGPARSAYENSRSAIGISESSADFKTFGLRADASPLLVKRTLGACGFSEHLYNGPVSAYKGTASCYTAAWRVDGSPTSFASSDYYIQEFLLFVFNEYGYLVEIQRSVSQRKPNRSLSEVIKVLPPHSSVP